MPAGARLFLCVLAIVFLGAGASDDDKEVKKEALSKEIEGYMAAKDWSRAAKAVRRLRAMTKGEEREAADALLLRINGEKEWEKIQKLRKSSAKPGKVISKLKKFIKKFGEDDDLLERGEDALERIMKEVSAIVDNFEDGLDRVVGPGTEIVSGDGKVKEGESALRWKLDTYQEDEIQISPDQNDWSQYDFLSMWIHSSKPNWRLTIDAVTAAPDQYFECFNNITWTGWKHLRLPLRGRGSRFAARGKPSWNMIDYLRLWKDEGSSVDIIVDDIRLEKSLK